MLINNQKTENLADEKKWLSSVTFDLQIQSADPDQRMFQFLSNPDKDMSDN